MSTSQPAGSDGSPPSVSQKISLKVRGLPSLPAARHGGVAPLQLVRAHLHVEVVQILPAFRPHSFPSTHGSSLWC